MTGKGRIEKYPTIIVKNTQMYEQTVKILKIVYKTTDMIIPTRGNKIQIKEVYVL